MSKIRTRKPKFSRGLRVAAPVLKGFHASQNDLGPRQKDRNRTPGGRCVEAKRS